MLRRAIASCLQQSVPCQVIVVDEASNDDTPNLVRAFPGVKYLRNEIPIGHPAAANLGIQESSGSWIKMLDDDDWLDARCIERMDRWVAAAESEGLHPVAVTGATLNVDENGRKIGRTRSICSCPMVLSSKYMLQMMLQDRAPMGTPVQVGHSREAAIAVGGWSPKKDFSYQFGEELGLWIRLAAHGDIIFLPEVIGFRTVWPGGASARTAPEVRFRDNLHLKAMIAAELGEKISSSTRSYLALHWAVVAVRGGQFWQAAKLMLIWLRRPDSIVKLYLRSRKPSSSAVLTAATPVGPDRHLTMVGALTNAKSNVTLHGVFK